MVTIRTGIAAPPFTLPQLSGRRVAFDPAGSQPKVLVFYKTSCPTCQFAMPYYDRVFGAFEAHPVTMAAVAQETVEEANNFAHQYDVGMPQFLDTAPYPVSRTYGLMNVPTMVAIGPDGVVKHVSAAFVKADIIAISAWLAKVLRVPVPDIFRPGEDVPALKPG